MDVLKKLWNALSGLGNLLQVISALGAGAMISGLAIAFIDKLSASSPVAQFLLAIGSFFLTLALIRLWWPLGQSSKPAPLGLKIAVSAPMALVVILILMFAFTEFTQKLAANDPETQRAAIRRRMIELGIGWHWLEYLDRASRGELEIVRQFWEGGMQVDLSNESAETVLHLTARNGHLEILREAIARNVDLNAEMKGGRTPLHEAVERGHEHIVRELIQKGADLDRRTTISNETGGCTPLFIAGASGRIGIVRLLADAGARIDLGSASGTTPLMAASFRNHSETVSLLLQKGANLTATDGFGANAMDYAMAVQRSKAEKVLAESGLTPTTPNKINAGHRSSWGGCFAMQWTTKKVD